MATSTRLFLCAMLVVAALAAIVTVGAGGEGSAAVAFAKSGVLGPIGEALKQRDDATEQRELAEREPRSHEERVQAREERLQARETEEAQASEAAENEGTGGGAGEEPGSGSGSREAP